MHYVGSNLTTFLSMALVLPKFVDGNYSPSCNPGAYRLTYTLM